MAGRGGLQQPRQPAAVSNPQSGARTDGGAGSKSQPLRVPSGGAYGERQAATQQQQGAPLAGGSAPTAAAGGAGEAGVQPPGGVGGGGAFGPTGLPMQPNTAGAQPNPLLDDPDAALRLIYSLFPHPNIGNLIKVGSDFR